MSWRVKGKHVGWLAGVVFFVWAGYSDFVELCGQAPPWFKPLVLIVGAWVGGNYCWEKAKS